MPTTNQQRWSQIVLQGGSAWRGPVGLPLGAPTGCIRGRGQASQHQSSCPDVNWTRGRPGFEYVTVWCSRQESSRATFTLQRSQGLYCCKINTWSRRSEEDSELQLSGWMFRHAQACLICAADKNDWVDATRTTRHTHLSMAIFKLSRKNWKHETRNSDIH